MTENACRQAGIRQVWDLIILQLRPWCCLVVTSSLSLDVEFFFFCYVPAVFVYGCPAISFDSDVFVRGGDIKGLLLCHLTCIPSLPIFDSAVMHINQMNHLNHFKCTTLLC